jgi:hypothetical protein
MKRAHYLTGLLLILIALAAFGVSHWLRTDSCLDAGGRWNAAASSCER